MVQPEYETVFEIGLRFFPWGGLLHPLPFVILGLLLVRFSKGKQSLQIVGATVAVLASMFLVLLAVSLVPNFLRLRSTFRQGDSSVIQGTVESFRPAPSLGAAVESFSVNGVQFSYNVLASVSCFHNAPPHKGPVRAGLDVRIYYKDGCIQRVDIRR